MPTADPYLTLPDRLQQLPAQHTARTLAAGRPREVPEHLRGYVEPALDLF